MTPVTTKSSESLNKASTKFNYAPYTALTDEEKQIVYGTLLGDGCLLRDIHGSVYLKVYHGITQLEYTKWKFSQLSHLVSLGTSGPGITTRNDGTQRCHFSSRRHPELKPLWQSLYSSGRKIVTRKYLNLMGPLAIAIWWMDDGYSGVNKLRRCRYGSLATCAFSFEENLLIQRWFRNMYGIETAIKYAHKDKRDPYIRFNGTNMKRLRKLILPYVPQCMSYKIDMHYDVPELYNVEFLPVRNLFSPVRNVI
jgi:recombination protein RecA